MALSFEKHSKMSGPNVAFVNELRVLRALHLFGHLRRSEIAMAVWPNSSTASARLMAQRTVKRMLKKQLIFERRNSLGGISLLLAKKGAALLSPIVKGDVREGYDITSVAGSQFFHRTLGTCYLLECVREGATVWGEYALARGLAPVSVEALKSQYEKVPDGLAAYPEVDEKTGKKFSLVNWVEVESAFKVSTEIHRILNLAFYTGKPLAGREDLRMNKVVFLFEQEQSHLRRIRDALLAALNDASSPFPASALSSIVIAQASAGFPLAWHGVEQRTAWSLVHDPMTNDDSYTDHDYDLSL